MVVPVGAPGTAAGTDLVSYLNVSPEFVSTISLPLGARLDRAGETQYVVVLPKMDFFDVWLQPTAEASVMYAPTPARPCQCRREHHFTTWTVLTCSHEGAAGTHTQPTVAWTPSARSPAPVMRVTLSQRCVSPWSGTAG